MRCKRALLATAIVTTVLWLGIDSGASAVETDKLKLSLSITSKAGDGGSSDSYSWAGDGTHTR